MEPSSLAIQLCQPRILLSFLLISIAQNLKELDFEKGFPAYKRLLIHQYQLAYLNVTFYFYLHSLESFL